MGNAQTQRSAKWQAGAIRQYHLKFNKEGDADIIARLDSEPNKQAYIRRLIRADMEKPAQEGGGAVSKQGGQPSKAPEQA